MERLAQSRAFMGGEKLLGCFVGDLIHSQWSGGSDERMFAHEWLDRRFDPAWYTQEQPAEFDKGGDA